MSDDATFGPARTARPPGMGDAAYAVAVLEIRQLAERYALALEHRDLDALAELFVEDVRVGRDLVGREALIESFASQLTAEVYFMAVQGHVINVTGEDHAAGTVRCRAEMGSADWYGHQNIAYEDSYERRGGVWYFVRRRHHLFHGVRHERSPLDQALANWPQHQFGRGTLPDRWPTYQRWRATNPGSGDEVVE